MTQEQARQIALKYANCHGLRTTDALVKAEFQPSSSPFNLWKDPDDKWVVVVTFPHLAGMDPNYYTIEVNCRTGEASHQKLL